MTYVMLNGGGHGGHGGHHGGGRAHHGHGGHRGGAWWGGGWATDVVYVEPVLIESDPEPVCILPENPTPADIERCRRARDRGIPTQIMGYVYPAGALGTIEPVSPVSGGLAILALLGLAGLAALAQNR